jgi:hypothetical protein
MDRVTGRRQATTGASLWEETSYARGGQRKRVVVKEPPREEPHQYRACPTPPIDVPRIARPSLLLVDGRNGERRSAGSVKEFLGRGRGGEVLNRRQQVGERWRGEKARRENGSQP